MPKITITLRQILDANPCYNPYQKNLVPIAHDLDAPITFREIAEKVCPNDLIWCFTSALPNHDTLKRHFSIDCAERVKHLMMDPRSVNALVVARKHAMGEATDAELNAAWGAASGAAWEAARAAARAAASGAEREWQVERIIQLTDAGEWSPIIQDL